MIYQLHRRSLLFREALGVELRELRLEEGLTLRDVCAESVVSLAYLSEVERGHKEVSSELLGSICEVLGVDLPLLLRNVALRLESDALPVRDTQPIARAA